MLRRRTGAALLEVLVALLIISSAGAAATSLVQAALRAESVAAEREHELLDADRLLTATSLLKRGELDLRLGERVVGPWRVVIQRPEMTLYRVAIGPASAPEQTLLVTLLHRPETGEP